MIDWKSLLIKLLLMVLTPLAAQLHLNAGPSDLTALATDLADLAVLLYGVYRSSGMKLVPHRSTALDIPPEAMPAPGKTVKNITAKVVGALLLGFLLFGADRAQAAPTADPLAAFRKFEIADLQAALDDAKANNDDMAVQCWAAFIVVVQTAKNPLPPKFGAFFLFQKARDAVIGIDRIKAGIGPIADLKNKCAAVIVDTNTFLIRLGVIGGGAAVGLPF